MMVNNAYFKWNDISVFLDIQDLKFLQISLI